MRRQQILVGTLLVSLWWLSMEVVVDLTRQAYQPLAAPPVVVKARKSYYRPVGPVVVQGVVYHGR